MWTTVRNFLVLKVGGHKVYRGGASGSEFLNAPPLYCNDCEYCNDCDQNIVDISDALFTFSIREFSINIIKLNVKWAP